MWAGRFSSARAQASHDTRQAAWSPETRPPAITITIEQTPLRHELEESFRLFPLLSFYRGNIDAMRQRLHHSIVVAPDDPNLHTTNCYAFAFGLGGRTEYHRLVAANKTATPIIDSMFVMALIAHHDLHEIGPADPVAAGDLAVYFQDDRVVHCGIVISDNGRIRSKWGTNVVHEHEAGEVPAPYGDTIRFFAVPDPARVFALLRAAA